MLGREETIRFTGGIPDTKNDRSREAVLFDTGSGPGGAAAEGKSAGLI
jgi:hypothetical protein